MAQVSPRVVFITVVALLLFLYPPSRSVPSPRQRDYVSSLVSASWEALDKLNTSHYGDFSPWSQATNETDRETRQGYLNLTGFDENSPYAWDLYPRIQEQAREQVNYAIGAQGLAALEEGSEGQFAQYSNITSWLKGTWIRSSLDPESKPAAPNVSALAPSTHWASVPWERNITGPEGAVWLRLVETDDDEPVLAATERRIVREVAAALSLRDESSTAGGWDFGLRGVHFVETGTTILTTGSAKFSGIYGLPHLALSEIDFGLMQRELNHTLPKAIMDKEKELRNTKDFDPQPETPKCELVMFLQQQPVETQNRLTLERIEHEIRFLDGPVMPSVPSIRASAIMFSPDCGYVLQSKGPPDQPPTALSHLKGKPIQHYTYAVRHTLIGSLLVLGLQLWLLMRQMKISNTPARQSRISMKTISMMTIGDGFVWFSFTCASPVTAELGPLLLMAGFIAFLGGSLFPMRLLMDIWNAQEPERAEREREAERVRERQAASAETTNAADPSQAQSQENRDTLPPPVTAVPFIDTSASPLPTPATNPVSGQVPQPFGGMRIIALPDRPTFGSVYGRIMLLDLAILFLTIHALTSFSAPVLRFYSRLITFAYLSFWVPQICRNLQRNSSRAFAMPFVVGQSILRLLPFVYIWIYTDNVLFIESDRVWVCVLAAWLWIQCCVLAAQENLGARFLVTEEGLPGRFWAWTGLKQAWDWHPLLREDEEGATLPVGVEPDSPVEERGRKNSIDESLLAHEDGKRIRKGKRAYECAICMQRFEVPVVALGDQAQYNPATILERRKYMVTPCRHIFHSACLEAWIGMRLQCPICREALPPM